MNVYEVCFYHHQSIIYRFDIIVKNEINKHNYSQYPFSMSRFMYTRVISVLTNPTNAIPVSDWPCGLPLPRP